MQLDWRGPLLGVQKGPAPSSKGNFSTRLARSKVSRISQPRESLTSKPPNANSVKLAAYWIVVLSRSLYRSHVLNTFFGLVLGAMMKQVCWHSRRSEAHRGLASGRPRTQNVMARGQSEAHGDSNHFIHVKTE